MPLWILPNCSAQSESKSSTATSWSKSGCAVSFADLLRRVNGIGRNKRPLQGPCHLKHAKKKPRFSTPGPGERPYDASFGQGLEPSPRGLPPTHRAELETAEASFKQRAPNGRSSLYLVAAGVSRARQSCSQMELRGNRTCPPLPTDPEETCQHRTQASGVAGRLPTPRPLQAVHRGFRPLQQPGGPGLLTLPPSSYTWLRRAGSRFSGRATSRVLSNA